MRKFVIAAAIAATASVASAGTVAPTVEVPTVVEVAPAPAPTGSLGGASTWIILGIAAALVAATQID